MNLLAPRKSLKSFNPRCAALMAMAEQELSAFFSAVSRLFGSEEARLSAEDWLRELIEKDGLPNSIREWRLITAKVLTQLASRLNAASLSTEFTHA